MFKLEKEKTHSTPYILVDESIGYMKFVGESYNENALEFYREIMIWLKEYLQTEFGLFTFDCEMQYFNSSTAKLLLEMLMLMDNAERENNHIVINWICHQFNEVMVMCGEDFQLDLSKLEFNMIIKDAEE